MAYLFNRILRIFELNYRRRLQLIIAIWENSRDREESVILSAYWILRTPSFNKWEIRVGIVSPIRHPTNAFRLLDYRFSIITSPPLLPGLADSLIRPPPFFFFESLRKKGGRSILRPVFTRSTNRYYISVDSTAPLASFHFLAGSVIPFSCGIHSPTSRCDFFHRYPSFEEYCVYFQFLIISGLSRIYFSLFFFPQKYSIKRNLYMKIDFFLNVQ